MAEADFDLDRFERWMMDVVRHPEGVPAGLRASRAWLDVPPEALGDVVLPSRALSATERLSIYANMYAWRLLDYLSDDLEATKAVLGEDAFHAVATDFLDAYPPRHYRLMGLAAAFPDFLERRALPSPATAAFASDLARLEVLVEEVFHAPERPAIGVDAVAAIPPERFGDVRLTLIPAHRLLVTRSPVNPTYQAVVVDEEPAPPQPEPEPSYLLLWRSDYTTWRAPLSAEQFALLSALVEGLTVEQALERCADAGVDLDVIAANVGEWFQDWTADGLFCDVRLD